ncbi:hypothetical protein BD779DRAFT_1622626 [Infundibulicybe gibba]|nr:hypothetical protein BD779DRAFT_1622626 [Infundibulicybe gibba]
MAPYFGPQEPSSEVTLERYFLATDFISGIGYGAQAILYIICILYLWRQRKTQRAYIFILAYMTLLFSISSVCQVAQAHRAQLMFIENRSFPAGVWAYYQQTFGGATSLTEQAANFSLLFVSELLMIWRCWVVWFSAGKHAAYLAIFFPVIMLFVTLVAAVLWLISLAHPASPILGPHTLAWGSTYYSLIFSANIVVTVLILFRLISHRRRMGTSVSQTGGYTSLIAMIIESSAMYSLIGGTCLITYGVGSPVNIPFVSASITAQQISGYLLIVRLAHGQLWQKETTVNLTVVKFNSSASNSQIGGEQDLTSVKPEIDYQ